MGWTLRHPGARNRADHARRRLPALYYRHYEDSRAKVCHALVILAAETVPQRSGHAFVAPLAQALTNRRSLNLSTH